MRIALITDGLHPYVMGGMQRHSTMLALHLPAHGVELVVFHTAHSETAIAAAKIVEGLPGLVQGKIQYIFVEYPKKGRLPGHYIQDGYQYSKRLLEAYQENVIECDFIYAQGLSSRAFIEAKRNGTVLPPIGVNCHGYEMFQRSASVRNKLEHLLLRKTFKDLTQRADYVFSFSGKIRAIVEKRLRVDEPRILEVPNGIDGSWIRSCPSTSNRLRRFIFLGRYERRKGIEELHSVLNNWRGPEIEFVFVGPIPKEKQLNLPWVQYRGAISDPDALQAELDQGDVLVCPSYSEGMPTVILEAMARGLAIVATDVGATSEVVSAENGYLIPELSLDSLRGALQALLELSDTDLARLQASSLAKVKAYSWQCVAEKTMQQIQAVIENK